MVSEHVDPALITTREGFGAALTTLRHVAGLTFRDVEAITKIPGLESG